MNERINARGLLSLQQGGKATRLLPKDNKTKHQKVCVLGSSDARSLLYAGIEHKCNSRRHHHYSRHKAEEMVKAGELTWLGKHRKVATHCNPRLWAKIYK